MAKLKITRTHLTISLVVIAVLFIGYIALNNAYGFVKDPKITDFIYDGLVVAAVVILFFSWKIQKDELAEKARKREEDEAAAGASEAEPANGAEIEEIRLHSFSAYVISPIDGWIKSPDHKASRRLSRWMFFTERRADPRVP